jgi:hypothetical protein
VLSGEVRLNKILGIQESSASSSKLREHLTLETQAFVLSISGAPELLRSLREAWTIHAGNLSGKVLVHTAIPQLAEKSLSP